MNDTRPLPMGGAKTSTEPFDLTQIPLEFERRLGKIFRAGDNTNWRKGVGDTAYQLERANHALKHLKIYIHWLRCGEYLGEDAEDDLAKVAWFCATQAELERLEQLRRAALSRACEKAEASAQGRGTLQHDGIP